MIGPVPGMKNYWTAVGVMAGFCQAGGVGKTLAEWMIEGEPSIDVWAMDIARFGDFATPEWGVIKSSENYERRFVMTFPNETCLKEGVRKQHQFMTVLPRKAQYGKILLDLKMHSGLPHLPRMPMKNQHFTDQDLMGT